LSISILYGANRRLIAADRISIDTAADGFSALQAFAEGAFRSIVRNEIDVALRMKSVPKGAFQLYSRARNVLGSFTPAGVHQAIASLEDCVSLEPDFARGWALLGKAYSIAWRFSWATKARDSLAESVHLTDRALAMAPRDPVIMAQSAFALKWAGEQDRAQHESDEALALGLSEPDEVGELAVILQNRGQTPEAISLLTRSLRASPDDPDHRLWTLGDILFSTKRYDEALTALRRVRNTGQASRLAAACSARLGLDPDRYVREVLAIQPDFSVRRWIGIQPPATGDELDDYSSALLEAGLPP
jgi:tetratricopeptide (TPR) repeat protein